MKISHKQTHLGSDEHKEHHNEKWREDANKYITDKTRHFDLRKSMNKII